ncbi:MAG: AAA family ATPase [Planctomycetes bacterium]|nr:AAA family ATPase [Planctomycetota bacterium]
MNDNDNSPKNSDHQRLQKLIKGCHPCIQIVTHEESLARSLIFDAAEDTQRDIWLWSVISGVWQGVPNSKPIADTSNPAAGLLYLSHLKDETIAVAFDLVEHLSDARTLRVLRHLISNFDQSDRTLVLIDHNQELPAAIQSYTTRFDISLPDEAELEQIIYQTLRSMNKEQPITIDITRTGLKTIIRNLRGLTRRQAQQIISDSVAEDQRFDQEDINKVLARKRQILHAGGLLEYVESPTDLNEIGGLNHLKNWLYLRQNALEDKALEFGINAPRGVLMLGVQGAGKSLCAKAIATAWQRPLLRMDTGALYDRYIGESERRLRMSLHQAEMMAPIILWIDEIEKAFASAASRSSDGGLSQRMFGTLLTWMQEHQSPVFLVATANDIEALPPELLRKGRFDEIFFVDLPKRQTRKEILAIHLRKRRRNPGEFNLETLADASEGFSGAEIEQAIVSALHEAFANGTYKLTTELVLNAIQNSPPLSVTMAERIQALRQWAVNRCVPAD